MGNTTLWIQAKTGDTPPQYTGVLDRKLISATYPIEGVLGTGQLKVTQRAAGANMSVDVASGGCVVQCDTVANGGSYLTFEDATVNLTIPAAPASGTRTHFIYEKIADPQSDGGSSYVSGPFVSQDAGSGAPVVPSAYLLATVAVAHGQASVVTANITDMRNQASGPVKETDGVTSDNLSGAGRITVSHGLGVRPGNIQITMAGGGNGGVETYFPNLFWNSSTPDDTTFIVEFIKTDGTTGTGGQPVVFTWRAKR